MALTIATQGLDLVDVRTRALREIVRELLDVIAAAPRVHRTRRPRFELQLELGVARDSCGEVSGKRERLVERVGVEALRMTLRRGHRLDRSTNDVVVDVLRSERPSGGLTVRPQREALVVLRRKLRHELGPQESRRAKLCTSMKKFIPMAKKNESRGAKLSTLMPAAMPVRTYSRPSASV